MKYPRIWIAAHGGPWKVANDPETPEIILRLLSKEGNAVLRWVVAKNPNAPKDVLRGFSQSNRLMERKTVARNPNTSEEVLRQLSEDEDSELRQIAQASLQERGLA